MKQFFLKYHVVFMRPLERSWFEEKHLSIKFVPLTTFADYHNQNCFWKFFLVRSSLVRLHLVITYQVRPNNSGTITIGEIREVLERFLKNIE